jgi:tetratricopeptide (TPR) repeat protein
MLKIHPGAGRKHPIRQGTCSGVFIMKIPRVVLSCALLSGIIAAQNTDAAVKPAAPAKAGAVKPDKAQAYYHYSLAHYYEDQATMTGRSDLVSKAVDEYRLASQYDPESGFLDAEMAELYAKTGRIREAVEQAEDILKRDPNNLDARKLLGRIYLRSMGDTQAGPQSRDVLQKAIEQYQQIVRLEPNDIDNHLLLGRLYRLNNDLVKAESEFKAAVAMQPDSEEAVTSLAYLYNEEGDSARAVKVLTNVANSSQSSKLFAALGYTYEQQKDYKKAIDAYKKSVELDSDNLDSVRGLAQNLLNDGQTEAALEQYKAITEADPQDAQAHLRIAELYRRTGKFDQALESLKKTSSLVSDSLEVPYNTALVYEAQGRYDEAAQILQGLLKKTEKPNFEYTAGDKNNRSVFLERLGTIYREQHKTDASVDTFRQMLDLGDDNASRGYQQIVETYRDAKLWQKATDVAREAVQKLPNDKQLKMVLASQQADIGQGDAAVAQLKALLKGTPEDRDIYIALGQVEARLRHWPEAEAALNEADKLSKPDEKDYIAFVRGSILERQKKYDEAEAAFKQVIAGDPHNATALNYLGYMLADRGLRLDEAIAMIKKALVMDPQNGAYLDSLGWAYYKQGNYDLAEENLRRASEKIGNDATIQDHLGELYFKTGKMKLAAAHFERALAEWNNGVQTDADPTDIARVTKKLESAKVKLAKESAQAVKE